MLGVLAQLGRQEPVDEGCLVGIRSPAMARISEARPIQRSLKIVQVPVRLTILYIYMGFSSTTCHNEGGA